MREYWILYLLDSPFNKEPNPFIFSSPVTQLMEEEGQRFEGSYRPMEDKVGCYRTHRQSDGSNLRNSCLLKPLI